MLYGAGSNVKRSKREGKAESPKTEGPIGGGWNRGMAYVKKKKVKEGRIERERRCVGGGEMRRRESLIGWKEWGGQGKQRGGGMGCVVRKRRGGEVETPSWVTHNGVRKG